MEKRESVPVLRQFPGHSQKLTELFLNFLDHRPAIRILHWPRGNIEILRREHVQELGLFGQSIFPKIRYLLVQPDFFLKDCLRCPCPFKLKNEIVFFAVELVPVPDNRVRLVAVKGFGR